MKQAEYLTKELSEFVNKLDLPSSIIVSYSDIEIHLIGELFIIGLTLEKVAYIIRTK